MSPRRRPPVAVSPPKLPLPLLPRRALTTPTWLFALVVLGLNDHVLKGSGALPGALTGKLSDVAGLLVAPALLAALLGVRRTRGLALCHALVGLWFAAINLSGAAADVWSRLLGALGLPWHTTVDPSDLWTLPALALSWRLLTPAMRPRARPASTRRLPVAARPLATRLCALVGVSLCLATSPPRQPRATWIPPIVDGTIAVVLHDVYIHEGSLELTCDDGFRRDVPVVVEERERSSWARFQTLPPARATCKLRLVGLPGSHGPIRASTRLVVCHDAGAEDSLRCETRDPASAPAS